MAYTEERLDLDQALANEDPDSHYHERALKLATDLSNSALDDLVQGHVNSVWTVEFLAYAIDRFGASDINERMIAAVLTGNLTRIVAIRAELRAYLDDWAMAEAERELA